MVTMRAMLYYAEIFGLKESIDIHLRDIIEEVLMQNMIDSLLL